MMKDGLVLVAEDARSLRQANGCGHELTGSNTQHTQLLLHLAQAQL
jgi:hypothetical protein